jgi:hypothetical protein
MDVVSVDKDRLFQLGQHISASNMWVPGHLFSFTFTVSAAEGGGASILKEKIRRLLS